MITAKSIYEFSSSLSVLYVEDDPVLRAETVAFFEPFFERIDTASNGKEGLEKYDDTFYDIVITDINMPVMNGIEMIERIHEINPDQKIIAISAHSESEILIDLIISGVSSFILKPIIQKKVLKTLYRVCRDAKTQQTNEELFRTLNEQRFKLAQQVRVLQSQLNALGVKHQQIEHLLAGHSAPVPNRVLEEYFEADEDQGRESVLFNSRDCDEMVEIMDDGMEAMMLYSGDKNPLHLQKIGNLFRKMGTILYLYSPFLDPLARSMEELGNTIMEHTEDFERLFAENENNLFALFDAIKIDMERYFKRFSVESMAMKNIHHIHKPTSMSIEQVIGLICPEEVEAGAIEFF